MSAEKPLVYFIIGTPGAGRRSVIADLIENGLGEEEKALVLLAESEEAAPADATLTKRDNTEVRRWKWTAPELPPQELRADTTVFFLADSHTNILDQIEALKPWLESHGAELARIFCAVDCQLAHEHPVLRQWFDACIHFSDVVFLTRREGLENKWLSDFIGHFKDQRFPCHFVQVKVKGTLPTPLVWLDPAPRRISQYFDEGETYEIEGLETDDEEDDEDDTGLLPPEPFFVRQVSGRRDKELPDVREYLPKK